MIYTRVFFGYGPFRFHRPMMGAHIAPQSKEKFVRQAEHSITNSKKGTMTVRAGYYTESDMKTILKFDERLSLKQCLLAWPYVVLLQENVVGIVLCSIPIQEPGEGGQEVLHQNAQEVSPAEVCQDLVYLHSGFVVPCLHQFNPMVHLNLSRAGGTNTSAIWRSTGLRRK